MKVYGLCGAVLGLALSSGAALAGPCSDDIATIGKQLGQSSAMGAPTTGTLSGTDVAHAPAQTADTHGTSADSRVGGLAGTKELDAASSNVATSDADVRRQQAGHPTASAAAGQTDASKTDMSKTDTSKTGTSTEDGMSRAKAAWQRAVDLNAQNDESCKGAIDQARTAMKAG